MIQNKGIIPDIVVDNLKVASGLKKVDNSMMTPIREFELKGHLKGQGPDGIINNETRLSDLAQTDFQLYEALEMLKTMAMLNQNKPSVLVGAAQ